jgi:hypothetical protein
MFGWANEAHADIATMVDVSIAGASFMTPLSYT